MQSEPVAHPADAGISMNAAATVVVVIVDCHSRQHVKHRSNQEVRAEEVFSYPRIPPNPHTDSTMTAIESSCKKKKVQKNF